MGTTGSVARNKDDNIEMNIADEAPSANQRSMKRNISQPSIFNQLKLRPKHLEGSVKKSASLRSSGSFDPNILSPSINGGNLNDQNLRQDFKTQKVTLEQEIQNLKRKEEKLETENQRLRAELQALNKQCQRLRSERDLALANSHEAAERAFALEQNREKIQRQFKIFRETKESEIQAILQTKRQLESNFHRLEAQGIVMVDDHNFQNVDNSLLNFGSTSPLAEWWAAPESEAASLFESSMIHFNDSSQKTSKDIADTTSLSSEKWMTSSNNLSEILPASNVFEIEESNLLRIYISSSPDCINDAKSFLSNPMIKDLEDLCEMEDRFLIISHFIGSTSYDRIRTKDVSDLKLKNTERDIRFSISISDIFICFLGTKFGSFTAAECNQGITEPSNNISSFLCCKQPSQINSGAKKMQVEMKSQVKQYFDFSSDLPPDHFLISQIIKSIRLKFAFRISIEKNKIKKEEEEVIRCIQEIPIDETLEMQQEKIAFQFRSSPPLGFEKCYDRLDEIVTSPGPVPPLLVSGGNASGKTLLLSSWVHKLRENRSDVIVLQHHVTGTGSLDVQPVIIFRRLLSQLVDRLPLGSLPPLRSYASYDVTRLRENFPRWLEQLSARLNNRVVMVIDSLHLVKDAPIHFQWLLDPLHVGVRVVISVTSDNCPEVWQHWPTLHLEPFSAASVRQLVQQLPPQMRDDVTAQCRDASTYDPLYSKLLSRLALCVSTNQVSEAVWSAALKTRDVIELYRVTLREIEARSENREHRNQLKSILQFVACSRDGLSEKELFLFLTSQLTNARWFSHLNKLLHLFVLKEDAGFYKAHNSQVSDVIYEFYVSNETHKRRCHLKMISQIRSSCNIFTPRNIHTLPWLLHQLDDRDGLFEIIYSPKLLHHMHTRGRVSELVALLDYLNEDKLTSGSRYHDELKKLESKIVSKEEDDVGMRKVSNMFLSLGRFQSELGLIEEAVSSMQKSLEISETHLDPDHPDVADSLHHLACVYVQWGKPSTAQPLFRQALELVEGVAGQYHYRVAQEISSIIRINRKSGKDLGSLHSRMMKIYRRSPSLNARSFERLRRKTFSLEGLTLDEDSLEVAKVLNDLGVVNHLQNNFKTAEDFFLRSLKMREELLDEKDFELSQSYYNLSLVHAEQNKLASAVLYMERALSIRQTLGGSDVTVLAALKSLALLCKKNKDLVRASELYSEVVKIQHQKSEEETPELANALLNQAVCESENGSLDVALPLYRRALKIYRRFYGDASHQVVQTLRNIALLLYQKGDHEKAAEAYKESMNGVSVATKSTFSIS